MREIKFRAWNIKKKYMVYTGVPDGSGLSYKLFFKNIKHWSMEKDGNSYALGTDILMQYTGLKDKNNKEIYEGDIFEAGRLKGVVKFDDGMFLIEVTKGLNSPALWGECRFGEVIGNIYENPELLKQNTKR